MTLQGAPAGLAMTADVDLHQTVLVTAGKLASAFR